MKNTLAENMLRFGVKNLRETDIETIEQLMEQISSDTNITTSIVVAGATPSNTSTIYAANQLVKMGKRIIGTVTEESSLTKKASGMGDVWNVAPKTLTNKHYIIIGNKKVIGDGGQASSITIKFKDYIQNPVEIAGNGIFAIGRLLKAYEKGEIKGNSTVVIGLNLAKGEDTFTFNVDLNEQTPILSFGSSAVASLIALNVIKDDPNFNDTQELNIARNFKQKGAGGSILNSSAIPQVAVANKSNLIQIDPIDTSNFQLKNSNINYKQQPSESIKAANQFINQYWPIFAKTYVTRLKSWVNSQAAKVNIDPNAYAPVNAAIDQWITTQKIQEVRDQVLFVMSMLVKSYEMKPGTSTGAVAGTKTIKGKEGSL